MFVRYMTNSSFKCIVFALFSGECISEGISKWFCLIDVLHSIPAFLESVVN